MTIRCVLCGEAEGEETVILRSAEVCIPCIDGLVGNEIGRRGTEKYISYLESENRRLSEIPRTTERY